MKTIIRRSSIAGLASLAAAVAIASCSLPPREAWHQIQQDGLIGFLANQCHAPASTAPTPADVPASPTKTAIASNRERFVGPPGPAASRARITVPATASSKNVTPAPTSTSRNIMPAPDKVLMATSVPSLPGFVRSPYTVPPRLVDVKSAGPGATMVCPYTQRAFIIPPDFVNQPVSVVVSDTPPATTTPLAQPPLIAHKNGTPGTPSTATNPPPVAPKSSAPSMPPPATNPPAVVLKNNIPSTPPPPATNPPSVAPKSSTPNMPPPATNPPRWRSRTTLPHAASGHESAGQRALLQQTGEQHPARDQHRSRQARDAGNPLRDSDPESPRLCQQSLRRQASAR